MAFHAKVTVSPEGNRVRLSQAKRWVDDCAFAWVIEGVSIRRLTLAERVTARAEKARREEPLPLSEIHGLRYEPPAGAVAAYRQSRMLAFEADRYAEGVA